MGSPTTSSNWSSSPTRTPSENETLRGAMVLSRSGTSSLGRLSELSLVPRLPVILPPEPVLVPALSEVLEETRYPVIRQFAMTASEEVVAAGPDGLFSFKRVNDTPSKPWSQPRPFPSTPLDSSSVSGIALRESRSGDRLDVFCVADGKLHTFSRTTNKKDAKAPPPSFVADSSPPLATYRISGTPSITTIKEESYGSFGERYGLVVPS